MLAVSSAFPKVRCHLITAMRKTDSVEKAVQGKLVVTSTQLVRH